MFNLYSSMNRRGADEKETKELETTGHDRFSQIRLSRNPHRKKRKKNVRRAQSAAEFDPSALTAAANKRHLFKVRSASSEQENSESEHSEKSPLVSAKLENFAKLLFNRSFTQDGGTAAPSSSNSRDCTTSPTRHSLKYEYSALDSGNGQTDRSPRERATRDRALCACQEWLKSLNGRYEIISHLDDIGSRNNKNWFLLNDTTVRTDRLMTLIPIPSDCVALEELPSSECPKGILMELLGSLQHPYIYPVLDLGFLHTKSSHYACLVMPFNSRGSLKDLIYKAQWNESWNRKYTRKSTCLPLSQIQRLGRQILEALLFLQERGFPSHGHLHSGNVILQNGVARLSGIENGLLGLSSRVNAVIWSHNVSDIENMDIICFGHLLFEMCAGYELNAPQPTAGHLELDLERYPQVVEVLNMIFESPDGHYPTLEELVLCDLFRNIDLREMRGPGISSFKHGLSNSTLSLLNAVRRRQGASLGGSYSEGSSPCTPPSTPRDRRTGSRELDSFDISSDSEDGALDEIIITPSNLANLSQQYSPNYSPIHICDKSNQSSDETNYSTKKGAGGGPAAASSEPLDATTISTIICSTTSTATTNQLTTESCTLPKNSTSRRMEYSMRGGNKLSSGGGVNNPSQDSAFGSMTDGEQSIASSSLRLSSFQSISSPIDEGVEDIILLPHLMDSSSISPKSSSSSCKETGYFNTNTINPNQDHQNIARSSSDSVSLEKKSSDFTAHEPPKILVNDQSSYNSTTSPSKSSAVAGTTDIFSSHSHKYHRVSSFEDMSMRRTSLKNVNKIAFRSLEEERRIDSAFTPIHNYSNSATTSTTNIEQHQQQQQSSNRVFINNSEKFKKLTHAAFSRKISTTKERHTKWKNSILAKKNNLIKSNESLLDYNHHHKSSSSSTSPSTSIKTSKFTNFKNQPQTHQPLLSKRGGSTNEISFSNRYCSDSENMLGRSSSSHHYLSSEEFGSNNPRKSRSERHLFSLSKLKQSAINDYDEENEEKITFSVDRSEIVSFIDDDEIDDEDENSSSTTSAASSSSSSSDGNSIPPNHRDVCQIIGGCTKTAEDGRRESGGSSGSYAEEKTPLLYGMEMSPLSPSIELDAML